MELLIFWSSPMQKEGGVIGRKAPDAANQLLANGVEGRCM
jgi:hypothetical protein